MSGIIIVSLGESAGSLTLDGADALTRAERVVLRTRRHPIAAWLDERGIVYQALDALYEMAEDFDALNAALAKAVLQAQADLGPAGGFCAYAVADASTDASVRALLDQRAEPVILPGVTQAAALSGYAGGGVMVLPAAQTRGAWLNPSIPLVVTEIRSRLLAGEAKVKLLTLYPPDLEVRWRAAGQTRRIPLSEMDQQPAYDHTTALYLPPVPLERRTRFDFEDLVAVMDRLRDPVAGCPWDKEQTHVTLREYVLEEACEAIEAINQGDMEKLADELGDVMLQVVFHACIDQQHGGFDIQDVTTAVCRKLIRRHTHIFGDACCDTAEDVLRNWAEIKRGEKGLKTHTDDLKDVPLALPALMRAAKVQKRARDAGMDWDTPLAALEKVGEEAAEVAQALRENAPKKALEGELGDLLFAATNVARLADVQPELALLTAVEKFIRRFEQVETAVLAQGKQMKGMSLEALDVFWEQAKACETA
jgi:tetrapyrrole methylase family protein/MazG family protein